MDSIITIASLLKDQGYATRLSGYPLPRLLDLHGSLSKGQRRAEAKAKGKVKPKTPKAAAAPKAAKKTVAKKSTAKKSAAKKAAKKKGK
jgi:DNA topoisomerase-1